MSRQHSSSRKSTRSASASKSTANGNGHYLDIPLEQIVPNPDQPRKTFNEASIDELAASIKENGLIHPIAVQKSGNGGYMILVGERRFRAVKKLKHPQIHATVWQNTDSHAMSIIENLQREDIPPLEQAESLLKLKREKSYSDSQIAKLLGVSRPTVNEILSLNRLPEKIKNDVSERCRHADTPSRTLLHEIAVIEGEEEQLNAWERYRKGELSIATARREKKHRDNNNNNNNNNNKSNAKVYRHDDPIYVLTIRFKMRGFDSKDVVDVLEKEYERAVRVGA